jgi:oligopeptide/dipeptide ABC transporter ATP-binding protein
MVALLEVDRLIVTQAPAVHPQPSRASQTVLLDEVSFTLSAGRMLGLVGESGCGKSLTALAIMNLLPRGIEHSGGQVRLHGAPVTAADRGRQVAMVFQEPATALNPVLTVGAQIAETLEVHLKLAKAPARARAIDLMKAVGIVDPADRFDAWPHQLSGGMRQRVLIAAAIACDPKLLIADEPTTALDVTVQAQILTLLATLVRERNLAVLLITHDLGVVAEACDEVAVMYAGRMVERGTTGELLLNPRHPYTAALLAARPGLATRGRTLEAIPGTVPTAALRPSGCAFAERCSRKLPICTTLTPPLGSASAAACHNPLH